MAVTCAYPLPGTDVLIGQGVVATGTTSASVAYPSITYQVNDLAVVIVSSKPIGTAPTLPAEWTELVSGSGGGATTDVIQVSVFTQRLLATPSGSVTVSVASGTAIVAGMAIYRSNTAGQQVVASNYSATVLEDTSSGTGYAITTPTFTAAVGNWICATTGLPLNSTVTPAGWAPGGAGQPIGNIVERFDGAIGTGTGTGVAKLQHEDAPIQVALNATTTFNLTLGTSTTGGTAFWRLAEEAAPVATVPRRRVGKFVF